MNLYENWININKKIKTLQEEKLEAEKAIYIKHIAELAEKKEGTTKIESDKFKVSVTQGYTYKVDQKLASVLRYGFKAKYELDKTEYKKLGPDDRRQVDEALEIKTRKPTFKVEEME